MPKGEGVHSWAVGKLQNNFSLVTGFFIEKDGQNKCVIFDGDQEHRSSSCTDKAFRLTLNINYEL